MARRNIVVLGASGMLGRALCGELERRGQHFVAPGRADVDLSVSPARLEDALDPYLAGHVAGRIARPGNDHGDDHRDGPGNDRGDGRGDFRGDDRGDGRGERHLAATPSTEDATWLINCAAATDVDGAENAESDALRVNGLAVRALAEACKRRGALLVHFSTDYVFDGTSTAPYEPSAERSPLNAYGRSKALGEDLLAASSCEHLVLRTSWLYAPWGMNFVRTMLRLFQEERVVRVVDDQWGRPSSCQDVARATLDLLELGQRGTVHVAGATVCSWYEFARAIHDRVARDAAAPMARLDPCTTADHPRPARRPRCAVLDVGRTERLLGPLPTLSDSLERVLRELLRSP